MPTAPDQSPSHAPSAADRRRAGRVKTPGVLCEWGQVLDLSSTGLRVLHKGARPAHEGDEMPLTIRSRLSTFTVNARAVRITKLGFRKWQVGVQILDASEEARRELCILARAAAQGGSLFS